MSCVDHPFVVDQHHPHDWLGAADYRDQYGGLRDSQHHRPDVTEVRAGGGDKSELRREEELQWSRPGLVCRPRLCSIRDSRYDHLQHLRLDRHQQLQTGQM